MATGGEDKVGYSLVKVGTVTLKNTDGKALYTDIVVCQDKTIVIDYISRRVRLYRLHDGEFLAKSDRRKSEPRAMCLMDAMEICVIHKDGLIKMMSIDSTDMSRVLKTTRDLPLQGVFDEYHGVVKFKDNLVVSGVRQNTMYWCVVSLHDGHVTIYQICKGDISSHVTTNGNIIYIACNADKSSDDTGVYGFDILNPSQSKYTYKHQRLQRPSSIVINEDGNIYVCNYAVPDDSIHQLTASCQLVAIFTKGIPWHSIGIFWDNGRLYVIRHDSSDITVFRAVCQGKHKDSDVETSTEIENGKADEGQSSINTDMSPSSSAPEDSEDEKEDNDVIYARERNAELHDKKDDIVGQMKHLNIIDKPIQQIVEESLKQAGIKMDTEERDLFLVFLREIGTFLHFSKDPQTLIDVQESLKTTEMFLRENHPDMMDKWLEYKNQGKLVPELIDVIYAQERYPEVHDKIGHLLALMEQLNIIGKARSFDENGIKEDAYYLTPCMLHQESPKVIYPKEDPRMVSTSVLCFVLTENVMQPRIFNELLAAFVRRWPVARRMETSENLMFCICAVFDLDLFHRLILHFRNHVVFARVTRMLSVAAETPDAELCTRVRKFITLNLQNINSRLDHKFEYELCVLCQDSQDVSVDSMFHFSPPFHVWFLDEEHDPDSPITREHMYHARLNVALVAVCGKAMRDVLLENFDTQYTDIYQAILANQGNLIPARGNHLLNQHQIHLVYPDHPNGQTTGTVDQFDISLLYTLIRNVSRVPGPITGWGYEPQDNNPRDNSLGASVERIRSYRNSISGHSPHASIEQREFEDYWNKFDAVLRDIEIALGQQVYCLELARHRRQVISVFEA